MTSVDSRFEFGGAERDLQFLYSPEKVYDGQTIHHWDKGSGKTLQNKRNDDYKVLAEGIARTINAEVPRDKDCLVVHKPSHWMPDMPAEIRKHIAGNIDRVKFCSWGSHTATNDFADIEYVFLAGVLQYSPPQYEATGMAAKGSAIEHALTAEELAEVRLGEVSHHILQAACRGKVRQSIEDGCPPNCHLYVIYSTKEGSGLPKSLLDRIFPKATVVDWEPVMTLSGKKQKQLASVIEAVGNRDLYLPNQQLMEEASYNNLANLRRDLQKVLPYLKQEKGIDLIPDSKGVQLLGFNREMAP